MSLARLAPQQSRLGCCYADYDVVAENGVDGQVHAQLGDSAVEGCQGRYGWMRPRSGSSESIVCFQSFSQFLQGRRRRRSSPIDALGIPMDDQPVEHVTLRSQPFGSAGCTTFQLQGVSLRVAQHVQSYVTLRRAERAIEGTVDGIDQAPTCQVADCGSGSQRVRRHRRSGCRSSGCATDRDRYRKPDEYGSVNVG
jgi:hypothetical protein